MIISKTPFRISLFGGGTDFPYYFNQYGGQTIGFSINKYCYIFFRNGNKLMDYNFRLAYSNIETVKKISEIIHPSIRHTCQFYKYQTPFDLLHNGDLPARTGLGSSSSFTVGMCKIFRYLKKMDEDPYSLAKDAIEIEQNKIKEPVGSQDQIFAAFGGFNNIIFKKKNDFVVNRFFLPREKIHIVKKNFVLLFTKISRYSSVIESSKIKSIDSKIKFYHDLNKITKIAEGEIFNNSKLDIKTIGELLNYSWEKKKELSSKVTNSDLDKIYKLAISRGAIGGKLLGAGGGGFFLFVVPNQKLKKFKDTFSRSHHIVNFDIAPRGSKLIL